jgi:hypothetical protein
VAAPSVHAALALDDAAIGPPLLLPAMIFRQVLFDPTEVVPAWLKARSAPAPTPAPAPKSMSSATTESAPTARQALTEDPKPARRARRPKADGAQASSDAAPAKADRTPPKTAPSATSTRARSSRGSRAKSKPAD